MKITLTHEESEEYFFNALCNGLGYVLGYGIELDYNKEEYSKAKAKLTSPSYEDVFMQMLRDGITLNVIDDEDKYSEYNVSFNLATVHERMPNVPIKHLMDMINENDDADTADVILQTIFFNEIIFG